jgi:hypothetical protein
MKLWIFQVERAPSAHLMWELPRIQKLLEQALDKANPKWINKNLTTWGTTAEVWDLGSGNVQRGSQGAARHAKEKEGRELTDLEKAPLVFESCGTTVGLIIAVVHFTNPINPRVQAPGAPASGTKVLVGSYIRYGQWAAFDRDRD